LGAIPSRLVTTCDLDASISSSSLDAVDSSPRVAPVNPTYTAASDSLTADKDTLLIALDSSSSSCLTRSTDALENSKYDLQSYNAEPNSLKNIEQSYHLPPAPVAPPRRLRQVTGYSSELTPLVSVTSAQNPAAGNSVLSSTSVQSVQEARAQFIQSTTPPIVKVNPRQSSLDQFDPLASGQLVVDNPSSRISSVDESAEENLLKEWDLDFGQLTSDPRFVRPCLPPRMMVPQPTAVYASMPNLGPGGVRTQYPGYRVGFPSQPVQPWMTNRGVRQPSSGPAAAMLSMSGAVDSMNKCATLPSGLASFPPQTQLPSSDVSGSVMGGTASHSAQDWTANIDILMRPHSMDLSSLAELTNTHQSSSNPVWEKFE